MCYPESCRFTSEATDWGCNDEKEALENYIQERSNHSNFNVSSSGLVIHTSYPHMGASPDGIVNCDCCGRSVLEIKCPFSCKDRSYLGATAESKFFLKDALTLKQDHSHYFQIQLQTWSNYKQHNTQVLNWYHPTRKYFIRIASMGGSSI